MSDRQELVERITKRVLEELQAHLGSESGTPTTAPAPLSSGFRHHNPAASNDEALGNQPAQRAPQAVQSFVAAGAARIGAQPGVGELSGEIASYIDHTLLKPDATKEQVEKLCQEARDFHFASVCVNPTFVPIAARALRGSSAKVCTVIGFPLGANAPATKAYEARKAIREGAREIDMVINVGALKSGNYELVLEDIMAVVEAGHESNVIVKVIIETALLTDEEKVVACTLSKQAKADFVKTSTGFASGGATLRDVAIMRATVGPNIGVKASGGVSNYADALGMIEAGATRIGASAGVKIVRESRGESVSGSSGKGNY